jgi:predicted nucleic-acid-binding Zn-ribbon protein
MESSIADASEHPASRYRAGDGVLFSSSKAPPGPGPENSCELPLGFIWTPLSPSNNVSVIPSEDTTLPPVLCLTCLAYLNLYASFDLETGVWICPLCESKNIAPKEVFATDGALSSVLVSPGLEFRQSIVGATPAATENPGDLDVCNIILVLDTNLSCIEAQGVGSAIQSIVADIADNPCRINIGLIIFGQSVSIYQLGIYGMASADVFATHSGLTEDHLNDRSYLLTVEKGDSDLNNLMRCISAAYGISLSAENQENESGENSTAMATVSRMERLRERKEARIRRQQSSSSGTVDDDEGNHALAKSPWTLAKEEAKSAPPVRCTGEAIQCAIDLATAGSTNTARTSRILLFTDGCPNYGDGSVVSSEAASTAPGRGRAVLNVDPHTLSRAVQYFDIIARSASEAGVAIDVLCTGALELGLPSYQALVLPSAGYVLPHVTFATPHLKNNLGFVLKHTFVSTAPMNESVDDSGLPSSHGEVWMDGCIIDVRTSRYVYSYCVGCLFQSPTLYCCRYRSC